MNMEWKKVKLGDWMEFNPKRTIHKNNMARKITMDMLIPYEKHISKYIFEPYSGGAKFQNGDTIMARITPCLENGKHAFVSCLNHGEIAYGSTEYFVLCGKEGVSDNDFVYYLTHTPLFKDTAIKSMVGSSGRQRAQIDVLQNLEMLVPASLTEQKRIAAILSSLDAKIENNNRINRNLEAQAQALFKSWFVDFEPFGGVMPEDWKKGNLLDVADLFDHKRIPLSGMQRDRMEKIYPYYGATSVMDYVDNYLYDGIYLLMGEDGSVMTDEGFPFLQYVEGKFWCNNHAHIMQGKNGYTTEMLYCLLNRTNVSGIVTGAVQGKISQASMKKIPVVLPPAKVCADMSGKLAPYFDEIRSLRQESQRLAALRDTLLQKLMKGEIEV